MEQIRLTCGNCNKRYRLPGSARGYFRCRSCDLVMAIPVPAQPTRPVSSPTGPVVARQLQNAAEDKTGVEDSFSMEELHEISLDPSTNELVHLTPNSSGLLDGELISSDVISATPSGVAPLGVHKKQQARLSPDNAACLAIGLFMLIGGWFTILLQIFNSAEDRSLIAICLAFFVALIGTAISGFGLRQLKVPCISTVAGSVLITIVAVVTSLLLGSQQVAQTDTQGEQQEQAVEDDDSTSSRFSVESREKAEKEQADRLKSLDEDLERLKNEKKKSREKPASRTKRRARESTKAQPEQPGQPVDEEIVNAFSAAEPSANTRDLADQLQAKWWDSSGRQRVENIDDFEAIVDRAKRLAGNNTAYWDSLSRRLDWMMDFEDGQSVELDFRDRLAGWYLNGKTGIRVDSEKQIEVNNQKTNSPTCLVATPDLFFHNFEVTFQMEMLKVGSGRRCGLGIVLLGEPNQLNGSDKNYVIAFNATGSEIRCDRLGNDENDSMPISRVQLPKDRAVNFTVKVGPGVAQVFVDSRLLVECHDPQIKNVTSVGFATLPNSDPEYQVTLSDWKVRKWDMGPPPGPMAMVEEDVMYFNDLGSADQVDKAYSMLRLAYAQFGACKFGLAAESARQAVSLGIPESELSLLFAIESDLNKQPQQASQQFASSQGPIEQIAKAWHVWFVSTHPDAGIRSIPIADSINEQFHDEAWVVARIKAAMLANRSQFAAAAQILSDVMPQVPKSFRVETNKQMAAYQASQVYLRGTGAIPFYHRIKTRPIPALVVFQTNSQ